MNIKRTLKMIRDLKKHWGKITYSQNGEDMIFSELLPKIGFYVDIGAFHPFKYSNTAILYNNGWTGLNIEPNPYNIKLFEKYRKRDKNILGAVSNTYEKKDYYIYNQQALNSFVKTEHIGYKIVEIKQLQLCPLSYYLNLYIDKNQKIDLMSIDCEGMDYMVLQSNNWNKYRPKYICVESDSLDFEINELLYKNEYDMLYITNRNVIWNDIKC